MSEPGEALNTVSTKTTTHRVQVAGGHNEIPVVSTWRQMNIRLIREALIIGGLIAVVTPSNPSLAQPNDIWRVYVKEYDGKRAQTSILASSWRKASALRQPARCYVASRVGKLLWLAGLSRWSGGWRS